MTSEADHPFSPSGHDFLRSPSIAERIDALKHARSHSRMVSRLRIALPVLAACVLVLYFISPRVSISVGDMSASVEGVVIEKGNLRMVNPKLEGANDDKGIYVITAKFAEQAVANPDLIQLTEIKAEMHDASKGWSRMTAPNGKFQTKTEKLELIGDIRAAQSTGMTAFLEHADIDMKAQTMDSQVPVRVMFPNGTLDARTMHLVMPTREVVFAGDVRTRMEQEKKTTPRKTNGSGGSLAQSFNSDQPIDIAAPKLTVYDERKLAHFSGGVTTVQGGSQMSSDELKIVYDRVEDAQGKPSPKAGAPQGAQEGSSGAKVSLIEAAGGVRIATADGRKASAAKLVYESTRQILTLDDNVVLSQDGNTLRGERMVSDLAANVTRFPAGGRVKGRFEQNGPQTASRAAKTGQPDSSIPGLGAAHIDLSSTRGQPIDVESDTLVIYDVKKLANFKGNVRAAQGKMTMRSKALKVNYAGPAAKTGGELKAGGQITSIRAEGKVLINTADNQSTTSDWAVFDVKSQTVTIGGNVVLSQGENVIKGDELVIDLTTNRSRFVNRGDPLKRQRVRGLFMPQQSGGDAATKQPGAQ